MGRGYGEEEEDVIGGCCVSWGDPAEVVVRGAVVSDEIFDVFWSRGGV